MWSHKTIGINDPFNTTDNDIALKIYQENVKKIKYCCIVSFSWKNNNILIQNNYQIALKRLKSLLNKISDSNLVLKTYNQTF